MPRISVIVPIYDVEPYLAACLRSVAVQTWQDLEVVMVDDGSPDASAEIAAGFAARDDRFRLVRRDNGGLGAARNTGIRYATGDFLMFLDSDDLLPVHALDYLAASLLETGSDIATGNVTRYDGRRTRPSAMHRPVFARPGRATHITRNRALLRDRLVTNKLWRRSFWDAHALAFPEGVLYEDIAVALRAHFLARSVDVLPAPVYVWRERDAGGRSITQDKARTGHLADRFAAVAAVRRFLAEHNLTAHIHAWDQAVLESDLTNFLDVFDQGSEEFQARFLDLADAYLDDVAAPVLDALPALRRVEWHLVRARRPRDLADVVEWDRTVEPDRRVVRGLWGHHLDVPLPRGGGRGVPAAVTRVRDEIAPRFRLDSVRWADDRLVLEGRAASPFLRPAGRFHQRVFAALVHERTGRRIRVPAAVTRTRVSARQGREQDWGGFRIVVDPALVARAGRLGRWHVEVRVVNRGTVRQGRLADPRATWVARVGCRAVGQDRYVAPLLSETGDLVVDAEREAARVATQSVRGDLLRLVGTVLADFGPDPVLLVTRRPGGTPLTYPVRTDRRTFEATVDLNDLLPPRRPDGREPALPDLPPEWTVEVRGAGGTFPVTAMDDLPPGRHPLAGREIAVMRERSGRLVLRDQPVAAFADLAEWLPGGELLIEGRFSLPQEVEGLVVTALDRPDERLAPVEGSGTRFRARLTPERVGSLAGLLPLPKGRYGLAVRVKGGGDLPVELDAESPMVHETASRTFELDADPRGRAVLSVSGDLAGNERGKKAQWELRTAAYPAMRGRPLREAVFFSSAGGTRFAGSPRAVYEELRRRGTDLEFLWHVRDGQVALPEGVDPVRSLGREHYEALARCRYVVVDDPLPPWFARRSGQVVVQTWHGSPAALASPCAGPESEAAERRLDRLAESAGEWTHLVSAGPWWTPLLREAFRFTGEILETGLPCDDLLRTAPYGDPALGGDLGLRGDTGAAGVGRRLGLRPGTRVVLYVPGDGPPLDAAGVAAVLGEDHEVLVWRPPGVPPLPARPGGAARDVSAYPDPYGLYTAADVLVTGDEAAAFDFAVTGRPVILHAADLLPHPDVPGPALGGAGEVAGAIRDLEEVAGKHAGPMEAFLARYRPLADGRAAARLAERVFGQGWAKDA
ncbi:hypothetical protein GCM10009530_53650 [Microbispora corallina]|uniref:Glycosyltransferase 2-like domain-containing protein n=1 Tax=Microbispora corallina TaxID=83302 RepID=A0ABQ4G4N5_9ACTN|nr:CDP-glycerol glycerophosphotransferase family protein [Microbispora corallina]GIH42007.1 hypothetical protein Mco01_50070 [Microbispora corallina]